METSYPVENPIRRAWRGNERLWVVWWCYGASALAILALLFLLARGHPGSIAQAIFLLTVALLMIAIVISWAIMVWRCAPNVTNRTWTPIARAFAVVEVRVTKRAQRHIDRAALWWDQNRPLAPEALDEELAEAFSLLSAEPGLGAPALNVPAAASAPFSSR